MEKKFYRGLSGATSDNTRKWGVKVKGKGRDGRLTAKQREAARMTEQNFPADFADVDELILTSPAFLSYEIS